ncbi:hypothetical protein NQ317_010907 [Molorchus minor]|uniref:Ig-like domain-containing protein n=1 Tax=Molorchus minor TaxID=1323400 RepID=A0ABQ9J9D1_9CUCU|nr:hypothetical protein NQ317_010907 [Molorchus minor]
MALNTSTVSQKGRWVVDIDIWFAITTNCTEIVHGIFSFEFLLAIAVQYLQLIRNAQCSQPFSSMTFLGHSVQACSRPSTTSLTTFMIARLEAKARILGPTDLHVKAGSSITLTCMINQGPHDLGTVFWYKGGKHTAAVRTTHQRC